MELSEARAWLDAHADLFDALAGVPSGRTPRRMAPAPLSRMEALIELLGSPQLQYPAIHITGTNGKTSTARMTTALLVSAGLSVGTDTSPYLQRLNERMSWNGEPISDEELDRILVRLADVEPLLADRPSYMEIINAAAFEWFADIAVDVAVIEVGLGGRWDATNVVDGRVAVVTNVEIDHVEYLGPTKRGIAEEKAGIVKPGSILVLGETEPELVPIFTERNPERVVTRGVDFGVSANALALGGRLVDLFTPYASYPDLFVPLHGAHQADNAAAALAAAECFLERPLGFDVVSDAFASVELARSARSRRLQPARRHRRHEERRRRARGARRARRGVPACATHVGDRCAAPEGRARDARRARCRRARPGDLLPSRDPARRDPEEVADAARALGVDPENVEVIDRVADAVRHAIATSEPDDQVVVAGSLYVAGPARTALR